MNKFCTILLLYICTFILLSVLLIGSKKLFSLEKKINQQSSYNHPEYCHNHEYNTYELGNQEYRHCHNWEGTEEEHKYSPWYKHINYTKDK